MYTPVNILVAQALTSIALAFAGVFLFLSVSKLIETKRMKSEVLKASDFENFKKQKLLPLLYFNVFADTLIFLLMIHVYCGFLR
jgi:hypothetical protein